MNVPEIQARAYDAADAARTYGGVMAAHMTLSDIDDPEALRWIAVHLAVTVGTVHGVTGQSLEQILDRMRVEATWAGS